MDSSQLTRLRQEASNQYLSRNKTIDSSFLTMQRQQKAAYAGSPAANPNTYSFVYDKNACPSDHAFTQGYIATNPLSQQEDHATRAAGAVLCGNPDYSRISPGITLKNCTEVSTITTSYNNNTPAPGQWKAYGYGINHYFPKEDVNSQSTCCVANKYPYPSG